jgi:peptidoglycan/xylan/chitin deacetylase (PgdA/CDA1 family)
MGESNGKTGPVAVGCGGKSARLVLNAICGLLPDGIQYRSFALMKMFANFVAGRRFEDLYKAWDHLAAGDRVAGGGGRFAVTHDVDYVQCHEFVPTLLAMDAELGVRATYNFLTNARYDLSDKVLFSIKDEGHEIGLHGRTHDRALGFRPKAYIREFVEAGKRELERRIGPIHGFRAPALAISDDVISVLGELGFKYDSSLTNCSLCGKFTSNCAPFKIGEAGLVEVPLTVQDSMFINDIPSSADQIGQLIERLVELTRSRSGALVVNCHPVIIRSHRDHYFRVAELLTRSSLKQSLMRDLV